MKRIYSLIGLAQKAGKVSSGSQAVHSSLLNRACLLVISNDISEKTRDSLIHFSNKQKIPWITMGDKYELGTSVGKAYRVALTINDQGLADSIIRLYESRGEGLNSTGVVQWPK